MVVSAQPRSGVPEPLRHAPADPGGPVPRISWPIVGIFFAALTVFAASTWAAVDHRVPRPLTVAVNAVVIFVLFTVVHDASHYSISSKRWVNRAFGRVAMAFLSPVMAFPAWAFIHIEHHRYANDDQRDPDTFASHGKWWQLPVRWAAMDLPYVAFYARNFKRRPRAEVAETAALMTLTVALIVTSLATGSLWLLALIYLIPERIAIAVLGWWFDWLPHHGLADTQRDNRYRATRIRVGMEWLLTPLMLSQNYHLVHHLHPSVPFYRYLATWRRNEETYLEHDAAIATVFGQQLSPAEFREWKELNRKLRRVQSPRMLRILPTRMPIGSSASHAVFHQVPVQSVERLTEDSVVITFDVPEELREEFRFDAGQHLTVRTDLGGERVRRNYSICSPATRGQLRIAVKHIPGGAFSAFALERLHAGDVLELMTPTGRFGTTLEPLARKNYVAIAAGSGITPILSVLQTTLEVETDSRFTLIYANRSAETTMFKGALDELESRHADRFEVLHVRSRDPLHPPALSGRIDREKIAHWLSGTLTAETVDEWFLCGPVELMTLARETLLEHHVDSDRIHLELFFGFDKNAASSQNYAAATVVMRLSDTEQTFELAPGDTILEAALQVRDDVPYACMGGACGTCKAKLVAGSVEMEQNFALARADLDKGYVLTCQSHPTTPAVTVDYDG